MIKTRKTIIVLLCVAFACVCYVAYGEGALTRTRQDHKSIWRDVYTWTIASNQWMTGTLTNFNMEVLRIVIPGQAAGTNEIDMYIRDAQDVDILAGNGATISNTTINLFADHADAVLPIAVDGNLSLVVTNANVDVTTGTIVIYGR